MDITDSRLDGIWDSDGRESVEYHGTMEYVKQYWIAVVVGIVGCLALIYGLWGVVMTEQATVEIVKSEEQAGEVVVDVAGAVEKPGVYKLSAGSRFGDVLVLAGGLSGLADREWVARTINLAEIVKDGQKIYIPAIQQVSQPANQPSWSVAQKSGKVNVNTASKGELDRLAGIGAARAQAIIAGRPYQSIEQLVSKAKIPASVFEKIKDQVSVY